MKCYKILENFVVFKESADVIGRRLPMKRGIWETCCSYSYTPLIVLQNHQLYIDKTSFPLHHRPYKRQGQISHQFEHAGGDNAFVHKVSGYIWDWEV